MNKVLDESSYENFMKKIDTLLQAMEKSLEKNKKKIIQHGINYGYIQNMINSGISMVDPKYKMNQYLSVISSIQQSSFLTDLMKNEKIFDSLLDLKEQIIDVRENRTKANEINDLISKFINAPEDERILDDLTGQLLTSIKEFYHAGYQRAVDRMITLINSDYENTSRNAYNFLKYVFFNLKDSVSEEIKKSLVYNIKVNAKPVSIARYLILMQVIKDVKILKELGYLYNNHDVINIDLLELRKYSISFRHENNFAQINEIFRDTCFKVLDSFNDPAIYLRESVDVSFRNITLINGEINRLDIKIVPVVPIYDLEINFSNFKNYFRLEENIPSLDNVLKGGNTYTISVGVTPIVSGEMDTELIFSSKPYWTYKHGLNLTVMKASKVSKSSKKTENTETSDIETKKGENVSPSEERYVRLKSMLESKDKKKVIAATKEMETISLLLDKDLNSRIKANSFIIEFMTQSDNLTDSQINPLLEELEELKAKMRK
ncbi:hypothetical protein [Caldiplasma sukawensis]